MVRISVNILRSLVLVYLFLLSISFYSCKNGEVEQIGAVKNRTQLPSLRATDITTVISDSGITRYRLSTPQWEIYDKASSPYWNFPMGIHLERFDEKLKVDANFHSNYAKFDQRMQLWTLRGDVKMTNIKGEHFETTELFWNQRTEKIYTDKPVKIIQTAYILHVVGFESNPQMTKYTFRRTTGVIPIQDGN